MIASPSSRNFLTFTCLYWAQWWISIMLDSQRFIDEHYPKLSNHKFIHHSAVKIAKRLLNEKELNAFSDQYPHLTGFDFVEQVLSYFCFSYRTNHFEMERIPDTGRLVIIANHPIGTLDGLALIDCVKQVRSDIKVVANTMLMAVNALHELLLPVNNMGGNTAKQQLKAIHQHLQSDGVVIVFPSGEVSRLRPQGVRDTKWQSGFLRFAKSNKSPILPIHINAKNSPMFYGMSMLNKALATTLLVKEMFHQRNKCIDINIGEVIPFESYQSLPFTINEQVKLFKKHLYRLEKGKTPIFKTQTAVALAEDRRVLYKALQQDAEKLGETSDGKIIYLYRYKNNSPVIRELGRLREITFRAVGEGSHKRRDIDKYDSNYIHLILWDNQDLEIAGAYRFAEVKKLLDDNIEIYSQTLFDYTPEMQPYFEQGLELGRSFVQQKYWGKRSLDYLWQGIGAFLNKHKEYRYLFGPVTISGTMPVLAVDLIIDFFSHYFPSEQVLAKPKIPYKVDSKHKQDYSGKDYCEGLKHLKLQLANMDVVLPTLYKQYAELCEPSGVSFASFNIDPDFQNCVDGLVMVDLHKIKPKKKQRYIDKHNSIALD